MSLFQQLLSRFDVLVEDLRTKVKPWFARRFNSFQRSVNRFMNMYGRYTVFEFAPFVGVYGLLLNFPANVLAGIPFTWETVVSMGLVFYFVSEELTDVFGELQPVVKINARVDN